MAHNTNKIVPRCNQTNRSHDRMHGPPACGCHGHAEMNGLPFPLLTVDEWQATAPMVWAAPLPEANSPCPWGIEMLGAACKIEHHGGRVVFGQLLRWDPMNDSCLIGRAPDDVEQHWTLSRMSQITLSALLPPGTPPGTWGEARPLKRPMAFRIELADRRWVEGIALSHVDRPEGHYFSRQVTEAGAYQRFFISRHAVRQFFMDPVASASAEPDALFQPGAPPQADPNPAKLLPVCTMAELDAAISAQAHMPIRRLGDTLVSMGLVSPSQLNKALGRARRDPSMPLGERLMHMGVVSREAIHRALHLKMGYPLIDLDRFPIDRSLLKRLPLARAQEQSAIPVCRINGQVVLVMDDPGRLHTLADLRFVFDAPLLAALPWGVSVRSMVDDLYADRHVTAAAPTRRGPRPDGELALV